MAIPGRPTSDPQVQPGHSPVPAYETPLYRVGRKGLNLVDAIDDLDPQELSRMSNMRSVYGSQLEVRPGQTALATTTGIVVYFLFLWVLRCFSSPAYRSLVLYIQTSATRHNSSKVSPFGNLRIKAC